MSSIKPNCIGMECDSCGVILTRYNNKNGYKLCDKCYKFHGFDKNDKERWKVKKHD